MTIPTSTTRIAPPDPVGPPRQLLRPLPDPGHFLFIIDNSAAERFICPTLARNYLVEGREPHPTNAALIFGGAIHVGIEELLRGEANDETLAKGLSRIVKFFTDHPAPLDEYRTLPHCLEVLKHYQTRCTFPDYKIEILEDDKGPLIERAFELPLGVLEVGTWVDMPWLTKEEKTQCDVNDSALKGTVVIGGNTWVSHIHVAWAGRIDVIARCGPDNRVRVIDHKTTSQAEGKKRVDFINDFLIGSQTLGYHWAAKQMLPNLDIAGFCLDAIQFKKPAAGCGMMDRGPRGGEPALDFFRAYFNYSEVAVANWAENALVRCEDFIHSLIRNYFAKETTYCFNRKYGKCAYHEICVLEQDQPAAAMNLLRSPMFRPVTWNPTHNR